MQRSVDPRVRELDEAFKLMDIPKIASILYDWQLNDPGYNLHAPWWNLDCPDRL